MEPDLHGERAFFRFRSIRVNLFSLRINSIIKAILQVALPLKSFCFLHLSIILDGRDRHEALDHIQFAVDKVIIHIFDFLLISIAQIDQLFYLLASIHG